MTPLHKRIICEIPEFENITEKIDITFIKNKEPHIKINLYDNITQGSQYIQFILPKDYTFKPPQILMNNKPFLKTLPHIELSDYRNKIQKPLPFIGNCIHCDFITKDNWSPALGMKKIIQEIDKIQKTRRLIQEYILLLHLSCQKQIPKEITNIIHEFL